MNDKYKAHLADMSTKQGIPMPELEDKFARYVAEWKQKIPGKTDEQYEDYADRQLYLETKAEKNSRSKPVDMVVLGVSDKIDTTKTEIEEKAALYANVDTRGQAIAEFKVLGLDTEFEVEVAGGQKLKKMYPAGTPLDTREYYILPKPDGKDDREKKGFKNPNFKRPLVPSFIRNTVGFGKLATEGKIKVVSLVARDTKADLIAPVRSAQRVKINIKDEEDPIFIRGNLGKHSKFEPIQMTEFPLVNDKVICEVLSGAPADIAPMLSQLMPWMEAHKNEKAPLVIFSGDVTRIGDPTSNGSVLVIIEDSSARDMEAEGTAVWVPKESLPLDFDVNSKVYGMARPSIGAGWNKETRSMDPSIERVQLNAYCIYADPLFRVDPDEASAVQSEEAN